MYNPKRQKSTETQQKNDILVYFWSKKSTGINELWANYMNIEEINICLKIVRKNIPLSFKIIFAYWIFGIILMIVTLILKIHVGGIFSIIIAIIFGSSTFLMWLGGAAIKRYKEIGQLKLTNNELIIFQDDNCEEYKLSEIEIIRFTITCEQGEPIGRVAISEGIDNYLYIEKDSKIFKYKFLIENISQVNFLRRKIAFLKEKEYKITISP